MWISASFSLKVIRAYDALQTQPVKNTDQLERGLLNDPIYLKSAREQLHQYADACIEIVRATGAKEPSFPHLTEEAIAGYVAERLSSVRVLLTFDRQFKINLEPVPREICLIDPGNIDNIKSFLNQCAKPELLHEILVTVSQRIWRHCNHSVKDKK